MADGSRVALVTGAGSGIGRAVALKLQSAGYDVALLGRRVAELQKTAEQAVPGRGRVLVTPGDVTDEAAVKTAFEKTRASFGRLDLLFNNAGTFVQGVPLDELKLEDWRRVVDVNLTGPFLCAREAIRIMKAQEPKGGRIINNGSISAQVPRPLSAPYTATKHAITGLTKSISLDGRVDNIACSQIDIGNAATDFTAKMASGILQANGSVMIEPRMDVAHVADAVLYIADLPLDANVQFMTVMATGMPFIGGDDFLCVDVCVDGRRHAEGMLRMRGRPRWRRFPLRRHPGEGRDLSRPMFRYLPMLGRIPVCAGMTSEKRQVSI